MATVVQDSRDLVASLESGKIIEPADVIADRAGPKAPEKAPEKPAEPITGTPGVPAEDDFAKRLGLTEEQHKAITETVDKAVKQAVSKTHRQRKEAEEAAAEAIRRATELEQENEALRKANQPPEKPSEKPLRANFKTDDEYQDALVEFRVKEQLAKERKEAANRALEAEEQAINDAAKARLGKALELVPDFEEVVGAQAAPVPPHIGDYMRRSDKFAELGYFFAKNPEVLERLSKMPARSFAEVMKVGVELDKISGTLQPFAPNSAGKTGAKASNGATPSETESGPTDAAESEETAGPSTETESGESPAGPSEPRETAPVIRPLSAPSTSQVDKAPQQRSTREEIEAWRKRSGANLRMRKRH